MNTHQDNAYIFGIDSFHFQNKMIESEYNYICNTFVAIDNRIYCEYYKLYKLIQDYIKTEINDPQFISKCQSLNKKFPIFKDLDNTRNYEFTITMDLHQTIMQVINELGEFLTNKQNKLNEDNKQYKKGLYIDNMINTINYTNAILIERINMFINFMEAFNKHHTKYFNRLLSKSKHTFDIINEDIHINSNTPAQTPTLTEEFDVEQAITTFEEQSFVSCVDEEHTFIQNNIVLTTQDSIATLPIQKKKAEKVSMYI